MSPVKTGEDLLLTVALNGIAFRQKFDFISYAAAAAQSSVTVSSIKGGVETSKVLKYQI